MINGIDILIFIRKFLNLRQNFNMTLEEFKVIFWWEWAHRQLGRLIGLLY